MDDDANIVRALALAALRLLAKGAGGNPFEITCRGSPSDVPAGIANSDLVMGTQSWTAAYTLKIAIPSTVFEIAWNEGGPVRIMNFSRGDWEARLLALAGEN